MHAAARPGGPSGGPDGSGRPRPDELARLRRDLADGHQRLRRPARPGRARRARSTRSLRLYRHLQSTDPDRFIVATVPDGPRRADRRLRLGRRPRGRSGSCRCCSSCRSSRAAGLGRALLARVLPGRRRAARATATDSAQPISNALYASYGIVPRMPLLNLFGLPDRPEAFGTLPSGVVAIPFEEIASGPAARAARRRRSRAPGAGRRDRRPRPRAARLRAPARPSLPARRGPARLAVPRPGRRPARLRLRAARPDASGRSPSSTRRSSARCSATSPRRSCRAAPSRSGSAGQRTGRSCPRSAAGFRLDQFPVLLCWDRPFADFSRYLPISPGLL